MRILMVGAGAVGQVYALHLARAGHEVSFFIKEKYRATLAAGTDLHQLGLWRTRHRHFRAAGLLSDPVEVARQDWDQVWLTVPSDALRGELASLVLSAVGQATVVCLQPDAEDADWVSARLASPRQLVQGLITFISYQSPLPGQDGPEGIAWHASRFMPGLFSGERAAAVVAALQQGGLPARQVADLGRAAGGAPALNIPLIAALEVHGWKLAGFAGSEAGRLGVEAAREALAVAGRHLHADTSALRLVLRRPALRLLLPAARVVLPLPLEAYLQYHFSKVGGQTRLMLDTYIRLGQQHGLPVVALEALRARL